MPLYSSDTERPQQPEECQSDMPSSLPPSAPAIKRCGRLHTLNHLRQTFLHEKPHEHHATRSQKTMSPIFGRVAERSERRYDKMVGEGDQLDNWDCISTTRWRDLGSKFWKTDSEVCQRGSGESNILRRSYCPSAARS
jgi:hypothetical protein